MFSRRGIGPMRQVAGIAFGILAATSWTGTARSEEGRIELSGQYIQTFEGKKRLLCYLVITAKNRSGRAVDTLVVGLSPDPYARRLPGPSLPADAGKAVKVNHDIAGRDCRRRMFKHLKALECRYAGGADCRKDVRAQIVRGIGRHEIQRK